MLYQAALDNSVTDVELALAIAGCEARLGDVVSATSWCRRAEILASQQGDESTATVARTKARELGREG